MRQVCRAPRCPEEPIPGRYYCARHTRLRDKARHASRPERKIYNSNRWAYLRRRILYERPFCAHPDCDELATDVDHITPINAGGDPYARANVQPLCKTHHGRKTRSEM
jgi:5-methylcytosine-specific restriction endonuclease McrA